MSRRYLDACAAIEAVQAKRASINTYFTRHPKQKAMYALVCETVKHERLLRELYASIGVRLEQVDAREALVLVMTYDLLLGKGKIEGGGAVKRFIKEHEPRLRENLPLDVVHASTQSLQHLQAQLPLHVRVNEFKCSIEDAEAEFSRAFGAAFTRDELVRGLFAFPHNVEVTKHDSTRNYHWIVQDKASCFPPQVLVNSRGSFSGDVIDACAAPGNKTIQLGSLMQACGWPGKVIGCDRDVKRVKILQDRVNKADGGTKIDVLHQDFLAIDVNEERFANVQAVMADPSCSGSGIVRSLERLQEYSDGSRSQTMTEEQRERLHQLSNFQLSILRKAASFPAVELIVYSTCSIHDEENEGVVQRFLGECDGQFELADALPEWHRRGNAYEGLSADQSRKLIRCKPVEDGTNGFFVACFVKKAAGATTPQRNQAAHLSQQGLAKPRKRMRLSDIREAHRIAKLAKASS